MKEKDVPVAGRGEALLRVRKVGICGTDLHAYTGNQPFFTYPRILGHELAAEVLSIETNNKNIQVGDKVVIIPYLTCGKCIACRNGKTNCCTNIKVLGIHTDGGMQEQITVPIDLLLPANNLGYDAMTIVEPLAIGAHALRRAELKQGETIVVIGCGPIGIGIMKLAQLGGARVIAIDMNQKRLDYAKEKIGVDFTVLGDAAAVDKVSQLTNGDMASAVFDATGHKGALETGTNYMSHGGKYILVGLSKGELCFHHPALHAKETTLLCSRNATLEDFEQVMSVLVKGEFPIQTYITHTVPLTNMIDNFESWLDPETGVMKATVDF
tara:strand:+ start:2011 stop:2985 length:975 start_codon:yes stop_codon:yes gene_type:complete